MKEGMSETHLDKQDKDGNRTIMKLEGSLVQILCKINPTYTKYLINVRGQKVLYVHLIKALYGMLVSAMLFYKKLKQDLIEYGFEINPYNPYNPCVVNKMVNGKQLTVTWHVDDLKVSHMQPSVVTEFMEWVKTMYVRHAIFGQGAPICTSQKQILNTRSSTEAELVGADDAAGPMLWTMRFMHSQGYKIKTVLYQDNRAATLMETNGRASAGKRSRHSDIRYFFMRNMKEKGLVTIHYCPTDKMIADYMTKPLHGNKFSKFRTIIMEQQHLDSK
ncbi:hypothetical protein IV203_023921 [Nitzschia inconspicua]|uniref:Uncharacterized protein n=1 Tax=Nitzschia inconspicua TaxID=303405 RepID=A0A9K3PAD0_9STRA|nr:hypothetical protein IV203_023921 [Nitzschia inconspicua]